MTMISAVTGSLPGPERAASPALPSVALAVAAAIAPDASA